MIVVPFVLGPIENNTYLAADAQNKVAAVIDPSFEPDEVAEYAKRRGWKIEQVWLTHAHFDHIAGTARLRELLGEDLEVRLHAADLALWQEDGGARLFNFPFRAGTTPQTIVEHGQIFKLGDEEVEVRHTPGHSPGHVVYVAAESGLVFCGDLIFYRSVGRTDLPGSSSKLLAQSIREQIYTLPPGTRLLPGHGPETSVGEEKQDNPFV